LDPVSQHKLYIDAIPNHQVKKQWTFDRYVSEPTVSVVALEQRAALMGMKVHPAARSASDSDSMNSVVRSWRSSGYRAITAITSEFAITFMAITVLMTVVFTSVVSMLPRKMLCLTRLLII